MKKRKKRSPLQKLEDDLWEECRRITFALYPHCYTCFQRDLIGMNRQCGHMYPKGALGASMKYDLRILRTQCFQCNINYGGMGARFLENMKREIGKEAAQKLYEECASSKGKNIKAYDYYVPLLEQYKKL